MISLDKRKEVFQKYFLNYNTQDQICRDLSICKGSVTKIVKEFRERISELGLTKEEDLTVHVDEIVTVPIRKKRQYPRLVVTDKHEKIIKKIVITNEKNRTRIGQEGAYTRANLYFRFESILDHYNDAIRSMHRCYDQMQKTPNLTDLSLENQKQYNEDYEVYSEICEEYELPKEFKNPLENTIYVISIETFYRIARKVKKELIPPNIETENESNDKEYIEEDNAEIEVSPPKFKNASDQLFYDMEHTIPPKKS